jgi:diguanylate cyclase (GGDEF)-like protein
MLSFFATHFRLRFKFILASTVLICRIMTIFVFAGWEPELPLGEMTVKLIQITNISSVFIGIIIISYIFSKDSNEAEGKLMQFNDRLQKQANTDTLTGLSNRRKAQSILGKLAHSSEYAAISMAMGDIDFFKKVNDTYGHDAGDEVLKFVARTMKDVCTEDAFVARWGGEEFLLVFPGMNGDEALAILEELRISIGGATIRVKDQEIRVTMTFGLTEYDYNGDIDGTIKEADEKLYQGKMNGRNQVVY